MIFEYNPHLAHHWLQIKQMIEENYQTEENKNATVLLGCYLNNTVEQIRNIKKYEKIIVYQAEPLVENHWFSTDLILKNIEGADEVWDYDLQNIEFLKSKGIEAKFRPPAYTKGLAKIQNRANPDIDVLFYGSYTTHRTNLLTHLMYDQVVPSNLMEIYRNINIVWVHNISDERLDDYISRSKIILNLRPYKEANRQQQSRIYYPIINNKCVLSEKSDINYFGDSIQEFEDVGDLTNKLCNLLKDDNWRSRSINYGNWIGNHKTKSKIAIFYHLHQGVGDWKKLFEEQIFALQHSGLYDKADYIHIGINGYEPLPYKMNKINRVKVNERFDLEADTLYDMWKFCKANPDYNILYFHAKGVSRSDPEPIKTNVTLWRKYLEHFNFFRWQDCMTLLKYHDTVGTEWENEARIAESTERAPCYAGNFWWAKASYINKLDPDFLYVNNDWPRWQAEFWIGTKNPNHFNFYNTNRNKYLLPIEPQEYMNI